MRGRRNEKVLRAVQPNAGIRAAYRRRLEEMVRRMAREAARAIAEAYRETPPRMAEDAAATPAQRLKRVVDEMSEEWGRRMDEAAPRLAKYFARSVESRSTRALRAILRDGGFTVRFKMTPAMKDVFEASVAENVALIKSIPQQLHTQVQTIVMQSAAAGRDLATLTRELQKQFGVTHRRAAFIARDQNNKATAVFTRARQAEAGITEAVWLHSLGGKEPRPTHLANSGKRYNVAEGWFDPDPKVRRRIWPGELINCRCVSKPVVKGFS